MTRRLVRLAAAIAIAAAGFATTIPSAQAFYGSFRETCRVLSDNGAYMTAYCQRLDGSWRYTAISNCGGYGVHNDNGRLRCGT